MRVKLSVMLFMLVSILVGLTGCGNGIKESGLDEDVNIDWYHSEHEEDGEEEHVSYYHRDYDSTISNKSFLIDTGVDGVDLEITDVSFSDMDSRHAKFNVDFRLSNHTDVPYNVIIDNVALNNKLIPDVHLELDSNLTVGKISIDVKDLYSNYIYTICDLGFGYHISSEDSAIYPYEFRYTEVHINDKTWDSSPFELDPMLLGETVGEQSRLEVGIIEIKDNPVEEAGDEITAYFENNTENILEPCVIKLGVNDESDHLVQIAAGTIRPGQRVYVDLPLGGIINNATEVNSLHFSVECVEYVNPGEDGIFDIDLENIRTEYSDTLGYGIGVIDKYINNYKVDILFDYGVDEYEAYT